MLQNDDYNQAPVIEQGSTEGGSRLKLKSNLGTKELDGMKPCPHCERMIAEEDRVCMHCGFDLKRGKTVQELNKKPLVSFKLIVNVVVVVVIVAGGYLYRKEISTFIDDKAGTNLTEQIEKYAPVNTAEDNSEMDEAKSEETQASDSVEETSDVVEKATDETVNESTDELTAEDSVVEEENVNPFASLDLEELTYKKEDLSVEIADLKEDLKYSQVDYKSLSKDLARAKKAYQLSIAKAGKYKAAFLDKSRSRDKRLEYKEQYIQYMEDAKSYKEEYSDLSKQIKELVAQGKEPKEKLAKKSLELQQVVEAIKSKK